MASGRKGSTILTLTSAGGRQKNKFRLEFKLTKHLEASSVLYANAKVISMKDDDDEAIEAGGGVASATNNNSPSSSGSNNSSSNSSSTDSSSNGPPQKKEQKTTSRNNTDEKEVGYLSGYCIQRDRGNNFHEDGDIVCEELSTFTRMLYDHRGRDCPVPDSELAKVPASAGAMCLIEYIEILPSFKGLDLGLHVLHEFFCFLRQPKIKKNKIGVIVMNPYTSTAWGLKYNENRDQLRDREGHKSEAERIDMYHSDTIKLRRQFSRMGFAVVKDSPEYVDMWFLSMDEYFSSSDKGDDPKANWKTKEQVQQLTIPMKEKEHIYSPEDKILLQVLDKLFQDSKEDTDLMLMMRGHNSQLPSWGRYDSKLTHLVKDHIKRLVKDGANLQGINALHVVAVNYKKRDLFDHLINHHKMSVNAMDHHGSNPLHVAVEYCNLEAFMILVKYHGADVNAKTRDGRTVKEIFLKLEQDRINYRRANRLPLVRAKPTVADMKREAMKQLLL